MFRQIPTEYTHFNDSEATIQPFQFTYEFGELLKEVRKIKPLSILEIGSLEGGTLYQWMKIAEHQVVSVDLPNVRFGAYIPEERFAEWFGWAHRLNKKFEFIRANSHDSQTLERVKQVCIQPIDFLFIDGDHTYEGAKADFEMYGPLVRPGGLMAFHDILVQAGWDDVGVHRLWAEIKANGFKTKELYQDPGQTQFGIGIIYLDE